MIKGIDFIGVTIVYFCHDGQGNFVMGQRSKNARDEYHHWDIGGGGLEMGDSVEKTLGKEIKEEYCTEVIFYEFLGFREVFREHNGQKTHWIALDFKVLVDRDKVKNGEPHKFEEVKWFNMQNLPEEALLHSQLPYFLEKYKNRL